MSKLGAFDASFLGAFVESNQKARGLYSGVGDSLILRCEFLSKHHRCTPPTNERSATINLDGDQTSAFGGFPKVKFYLAGMEIVSFVTGAITLRTAPLGPVGGCPSFGGSDYTEVNCYGKIEGTYGEDLIFDQVKFFNGSTLIYAFPLTTCDTYVQALCWPYTTADYHLRRYI